MFRQTKREGERKRRRDRGEKRNECKEKEKGGRQKRKKRGAMGEKERGEESKRAVQSEKKACPFNDHICVEEREFTRVTHTIINNRLS